MEAPAQDFDPRAYLFPDFEADLERNGFRYIVRTRRAAQFVYLTPLRREVIALVYNQHPNVPEGGVSFWFNDEHLFHCDKVFKLKALLPEFVRILNLPLKPFKQELQAFVDKQAGKHVPIFEADETEPKPFDPREYMLSDKGYIRLNWIKKHLTNWSDNYTLRYAYQGPYADFYQQANAHYFKEHHKWFDTSSSVLGFSPDPIRLGGLEPENYLEKIPDDEWEQFKDDIDYIKNGECLDDNFRQDLENKATDEFWRDNYRDLIYAIWEQPWAQENAYYRFAASMLTKNQAAELAHSKDLYPQAEEGGVWLNLEDVAKKVTADDVLELTDTEGTRRAWQNARNKALNRPGGVLDLFDKFMQEGLASNPGLLARYYALDKAQFYRFFSDLADRRPPTEDYPRWLWWRKGFYGQPTPSHWEFMSPVDYDTWRNWTEDEKFEHFQNGIHDFVYYYAIPTFEKWRRVPVEHPEFKFEHLSEAEGAFDPAAYLFGVPRDTGKLVKDGKTLYIIEPTQETIEKHLVNPGAYPSGFLNVYFVVSKNPQKLDRFLMTIDSEGHLVRLPRYVRADEKLRDPYFGKELRAFWKPNVARLFREGEDENALRLVSQLYGYKSVLKYKDRYDIPMDVKLEMGIQSAEAGDIKAAQAFMGRADATLSKEGVTYRLKDWSDLAKLFAERYQEGAEQIFSGERVEASWIWEKGNKIEIKQVVPYLGEDHFKIIREVLPHRTIFPYEDGQPVRLSTDNQREFGNDDIAYWLVDANEDIDPEHELDDIREAIVNAGMSSWESALTDAWFNGYKEAALDQVSGKAEYKNDVLYLFIPWKAIIEAYRDNSSEWSVSDLDDIIWDRMAKAEPDDDYSAYADWSESGTLDNELDYQLSELEIPPFPYDPNQITMPEIMGSDPEEYEERMIYGPHTPHGFKSKMKRKVYTEWGRKEPWRLDPELWKKHAAETGFTIPPKPSVGESIARQLTEQVYKYACTMIDVPADQADFIFEWGRLNIPDESLQASQPDQNPRETEQHVTVKYGLTAVDVPEELRAICKNTKPFPIYIGKVSLFRQPEHDVVKLDVESPWLRKLNAEISAALPHEDTYKGYSPHLTVAYVKKGSCDQLDGMDIFQGKESGVEPQFVAYGLKFKGAGDSESGNRTEENLLFSRVKKQPPVKPPEAAIESGPFTGLPFPADPSQVSRFFQSAKVRAKRSIL